jgi:hypothetical protein
MAWKDLQAEIAEEFLDAQASLFDLSRLIRARRDERRRASYEANIDFERSGQRRRYLVLRQDPIWRGRRSVLRRKYYQTHRDEERASCRRRYLEHRDQRLAYQRAYSKALLERRPRYWQEYYQAHREKILQRRARCRIQGEKKLAYNRVWREANRERKRERDRAYYHAHREQIARRRKVTP